MAGLFLNSGLLFSVAQDALARSRAASKHDRSADSNDPLVAIIFSAATVEAFVNEIGELAAHAPMPGHPHPHEISSCAAMLSEVEDFHGNTKLKYLVAKAAFTGETYDKGSQTYEDFSLLLDLRNSIMHLKFDRIESIKINEVVVNHPPVIKRLHSKNILATFDENTITSWINLIRTVAVANWACEACIAMVRSLIACIPDSDLKEQVDILYKWSFLKTDAT